MTIFQTKMPVTGKNCQTNTVKGSNYIMKFWCSLIKLWKFIEGISKLYPLDNGRDEKRSENWCRHVDRCRLSTNCIFLLVVVDRQCQPQKWKFLVLNSEIKNKNDVNLNFEKPNFFFKFFFSKFWLFIVVLSWKLKKVFILKVPQKLKNLKNNFYFISLEFKLKTFYFSSRRRSMVDRRQPFSSCP